MLDLFCGRFGWSKAFADRGWECVGVDLVKPPEIPEGCLFHEANVLSLAQSWVNGFDFICASSPCEEFSVHGLRNFHPNPKYPELGIRLFNHTRQLCEASRLPYVMENVRAAQQFVGDAVHHCGPFYLWGNAVPPLMNQGITKGTKFGLDKDGTRKSRKIFDIYYKTGSKSKKRKEYQAKIAEIPPELSYCVAEYAERLLTL
ncbi:MAG TPA: hypothetical protein VN132_11645 [Bdellovibrio sp.]|nr:hypothetical protein [Bdellovibrio sp.]